MSDSDSTFDGLYRRRVLQGLGGAGTVAVAGCLTGGGDGGATLNMGQAKSPVEFDPVVLNDVPSDIVASQMFEGLYHYDEALGHVPVLADGEPEVADGGETWTVNLVEGATFHNGDPVTAEDVRYSYLAPAVEQTENASEVNMIDSIDVVDETTVRFNLAYAFGAFQHTLHRSVVPADVRGEMGIAEEGGDDSTPVLVDQDSKNEFNKEDPIGSGPFEFAGWSEGEYAEVERHDDYWGDETPNLAAIRFEPVEEATTRVTTLRNGENHVIQTVPPNLWGEVEGLDSAEIDSESAVSYFYLAFNCNEGPTTDPRVREAIDYAVDMDQAVENFVEPAGVRQYSPLPRTVAEDWDMPLDEWESIPHEQDTDQAASLLEEAGVPKDYDWRIIVPPDDKREQIGTSVGNGLQEAGYENVEVQRLDWGPFLDQYVSGNEDDYNMYTLGWSGIPDPDSFTYYLFGRTDDTLGVNNGTYYGNNSEAGVEVADQILQARQSTSREQRRQLYEDAITTLLEDRAHLASYNLNNSFGVSNDVSDFDAHPVSQLHVFSSHNNTGIQ